jgi:DoxX-like family
MNVLLWILQGALAFLFLAGGAFKFFSFEELANQYRALPHVGWRALGAFEMLAGVLLIVPAATKWMPNLTPIAAVLLALEALALSAYFARSSVALTASNPMTWNVVMGLLAAFVAYGRFAIRPIA